MVASAFDTIWESSMGSWARKGPAGLTRSDIMRLSVSFENESEAWASAREARRVDTKTVVIFTCIFARGYGVVGV